MKEICERADLSMGMLRMLQELSMAVPLMVDGSFLVDYSRDASTKEL